jgi:predicted acyl esterase
MDTHIIRWFDHYLKGVDNGVEREPTVRYYAMGAVGEAGAPGNIWREAADFPPRLEPISYYLAAEGNLGQNAPTAETSRTAYRSDPKRPLRFPAGRSPALATRGATKRTPTFARSRRRCWPNQWNGRAW